PLAVSGLDADRGAVLQLDRLAPFQRPGANLRSAEIPKDRHDLADTRGAGANQPEGLGVRVVRAVRKIQPADIHPGGDQLFDNGFVPAGRPYRRDNLRVSHPAKAYIAFMLDVQLSTLQE